MTDTAEPTANKVLLVDDEESILKAISRLLAEEDDFEILTATSGEEGLELLKADPEVALILSDQRMPGMSGAEFLQHARTIVPDAVRMVLTGYADINATMDAINRGGASRYITKPWDDGMLVQAIREGVEHYRMSRENLRLNLLVQKQNQELQEWNANLKSRVLEQTSRIRLQNEELRRQSEDLKLLNNQMAGNWQNIILAFSSIIGLQNPQARNHSRNVSMLAMAAAHDKGVPPEEIETIRIAALLHDIGEIGSDPLMLRKEPEFLNEEELVVYRQHPVRGQSVVDLVEGLRGAGILIRHHHEHFDGSGFPDGLRGEEIPRGARLIAVADMIDSIIYRIDVPNVVEHALALVNRRLGSAIDPDIFPPFEKHVRQLYADLPERERMIEKELHPGDLRVGLVLSREATSGTGLLLLARGAVLDDASIASLKRYYRLDPPPHGVFVFVPR